MPQDITFVDDLSQDSNLTFVNYGSTSGNNTYRRRARIHNAVRGRHQSKKIAQAALETSRAPSATDNRFTSVSLHTKSILDPLSTYGRDPFSSDLNTLTRSYESIWRSAFKDHFHLPQLKAACPHIPDPEDSFLAAARGSRHAYRNIVTLKVMTSEARKGSMVAENVFRNQALALQEFRMLIDHHNKSDAQLTRSEFQDIFATAFSFFDRDFEKEPAYNAIVFVNSTLMRKPENATMRQLPIVEWIRTLMPRPGPCFHRSRSYQSLMLKKAIGLLDALNEAQSNAVEKLASHVTSRYFHSATSLYGIITTKLTQQIEAEPYPAFYLMCFHRILFLLLTHLNESCTEERTSRANDRFLDTLEGVASHCLSFEPPQRIALFLWGVLVNADVQGKCRDQGEQCYTWAMKDLHASFNLDFVDAMVSWLLYPVELDALGVIRLNFDQMRSVLQKHYEPV